MDSSVDVYDFIIREVEKHIVLTDVIFWKDKLRVKFRSCFVLKLIPTYRFDSLINWHYNEPYHGKKSINRIGDTIKNFVLGQIIINSSEDFCKAANHFFTSITTLFQISDVILSEPIEGGSIIPAILKIHKFTWSPPTANRETQINFFFLL